jgi:RNA polymerase sigma-70 factor (ECF subfamily)
MRGRHSSGIHSNDIKDAVTDAFVNYFEKPLSYDPQKLSLISYLVMAADGDLKNALKKDKRLREKEKLTDSVELLNFDGNTILEGEIQCPEDEILTKIDGKRALQMVITKLQDKKDVNVLKLMLEGERKTEAFAKVMGLSGKPTGQQRIEVKRCKDRILKVLQRLSDHFEETENDR